MPVCHSLRLTTVLVFLVLSCAQQDYSPRLVEYLEAEKALRDRIHEERAFGDSVTVLQKEYGIDLEKELSHVMDKPEALLKLLKELKGEK